ncbi:L,D-transpeptidase family protein [Chitinophagaceae bacterium MMS25-I14]
MKHIRFCRFDYCVRLFFFSSSLFFSATAQQKPQAPAKYPVTAAAPVENAIAPPRDLKVLEETTDNKGNIVRVIQYRQGMMKVTQTIIMPKEVRVGFKAPINPDTLNKEEVTVTVNKSRYCLEVFYKKKIIRSYKAVFGPKPLENKCMEGDRCTPEGWFKITNKNPNSRYNKFMALSYPNDSALVRFNKLKASGIIPQSAKIGGSVGIHGIWPGGDNMIDLGVGWTDGCVALKNTDIEELYSFVGVGTKVLIRK